MELECNLTLRLQTYNIMMLLSVHKHFKRSNWKLWGILSVHAQNKILNFDVVLM